MGSGFALYAVVHALAVRKIAITIGIRKYFNAINPPLLVCQNAGLVIVSYS
jgi:hypothetical protein